MTDGEPLPLVRLVLDLDPSRDGRVQIYGPRDIGRFSSILGDTQELFDAIEAVLVKHGVYPEIRVVRLGVGSLEIVLAITSAAVLGFIFRMLVFLRDYSANKARGRARARQEEIAAQRAEDERQARKAVLDALTGMPDLGDKIKEAAVASFVRSLLEFPLKVEAVEQQEPTDDAAA